MSCSLTPPADKGVSTGYLVLIESLLANMQAPDLETSSKNVPPHSSYTHGSNYLYNVSGRPSYYLVVYVGGLPGRRRRQFH